MSYVDVEANDLIRFGLYSFFVLCLLVSTKSTACEQTFKIQFIESNKDRLIHKLLNLALAKHPEDLCTESLTNVLTDGRESLLVEKKLLDIIWSSATPDEGSQLTPVRIPIFKGLTGYRIFVIRQGEQARFDGIQHVSELKKMLAGQGAFWGDTSILEQAGIKVVTSTRARKLWQMLHKKRFDYLPLGMHEPWKDIDIRPSLSLTVEKNILLKYPFALFFYINKTNRILFEYISKGMKIALEDGSYDALLRQSDMLKNMVAFANVENRRVIELSNPHFHQFTPADNLQYWLKPEELVAFMNQKSANVPTEVKLN